MTTKLRNLRIKEVSFVDEGANPDADITLKKNKEEGAKSEMSVFERIGKAVADLFGISEPDDIAKAAATFGEQKIKSRVRRVFDNVWWDYQSALRESIESILSDNELDEAKRTDMIKATLEEFTNAMAKALTDSTAQIAIENAVLKSGRKISAERLERMKASRDSLDEIIKEAEGPEPEEDPEVEDGDPEEPEINTVEGEEDMKIDKSKMTDAERAILEDLEKRYAADATPAAEPATTADPVAKANEPTAIHPEVAAEIASLKKFKEDAELREMTTIAKKYEIIGKKADELAPKLIEMQKSGSYNDYIAVLDEQVELMNKSGLFGEIGKRGNGSSAADEPWAQIELHASEIMKSNTAIGYAKAIDMACVQHPELVQQYEKSRA